MVPFSYLLAIKQILKETLLFNFQRGWVFTLLSKDLVVLIFQLFSNEKTWTKAVYFFVLRSDITRSAEGVYLRYFVIFIVYIFRIKERSYQRHKKSNLLTLKYIKKTDAHIVNSVGTWQRQGQQENSQNPSWITTQRGSFTPADWIRAISGLN